MPQAHHELHEEVHEVVGGENHGRVQRDHEAGPQRQVEIRSQLLHKGNAHTHHFHINIILCGREREDDYGILMQAGNVGALHARVCVRV